MKNKEDLDCPYDFTSRCTYGRCDCKPKESIEQRVEKALQMECKTVEEVLSKMYAKAHTKLEKRPSAKDGNYNYIHQIDTLNLIEETANEVSKIMYSEESILNIIDEVEEELMKEVEGDFEYNGVSHYIELLKERLKK